MDIFEKVIEGVISAVATTAIIGGASFAYNWISGGGLVRLLGGVTQEDVKRALDKAERALDRVADQSTSPEWARFLDAATRIHDWFRLQSFYPEIFITHWGGNLVLMELVLKKFYPDDKRRPSTYVMYELRAGLNQREYDKYKEHGTEVISKASGIHFFLPKLLTNEDKSKNVLIVHDWVNTGKLLAQTKEELIEKMNFNSVRAAVMVADKDRLLYGIAPDDIVCFFEPKKPDWPG
jgi:hypothetical protein